MGKNERSITIDHPFYNRPLAILPKPSDAVTSAITVMNLPTTTNTFSIDNLLTHDNFYKRGNFPLSNSRWPGRIIVSETEKLSTNKRKTQRRRVRTTFTSAQLTSLETAFVHQQYMVGDDRQALANTLGLNEMQVKVWFQNRRIKWRRQQHQETLERLNKRPWTEDTNKKSTSAADDGQQQPSKDDEPNQQ